MQRPVRILKSHPNEKPSILRKVEKALQEQSIHTPQRGGKQHHSHPHAPKR
jgi:hypothetical protein